MLKNVSIAAVLALSAAFGVSDASAQNASVNAQNPNAIMQYVEDESLTKAQKEKRVESLKGTRVSYVIHVEDASEGMMVDQIWGRSIMNDDVRITCNSNVFGDVSHVKKGQQYTCTGTITLVMNWGVPTIQVSSDTYRMPDGTVRSKK